MKKIILVLIVTSIKIFFLQSMQEQIILDVEKISQNLKKAEEIIVKDGRKILELDDDWVDEISGVNDARKALEKAEEQQSENKSKRQSAALSKQVVLLEDELGYLEKKSKELKAKLKEAKEKYLNKKKDTTLSKILNIFKTKS
ncbi:hypothetical protein [Candidatus Babela massiliensis]|uniref:Uncharacterized protein n=1 Tax=Candidatus Babela massiliensis TaxID=673862 RepID=V6DHD0_9BACT|nr:hypothetical protein [Candidatus Babela massiliensis]CDK30358.1 hypothetical protein BABL1_gene_622 [Candidatus Babela massiliensis]